jgi:hypothetical protein
VLCGPWRSRRPRTAPFFPELISGPFRTGLHEAFAFAIAACLLAALASWWRGSRYVEGETAVVATEPLR